MSDFRKRFIVYTAEASLEESRMNKKEKVNNARVQYQLLR